MATLNPVHDYVLVRLDTAKERSAGGIIIPETARKLKGQTGIVEEVGPGRRSQTNGARVEPELKRGDHVAFGEYVGKEHPDAGDGCVLLRESEVLAVLEE